MSEKNLDIRNDRVNDRDSQVEVVLADGTKLTRRPTEKLGHSEGRLAIPEKQGFERRWVSNEKPSNLQYFIDLKYVNATDKNGRPYQPIAGGTRKNGSEYQLYPLEISKKEIERLRKKHKELDPTARALEQQEKWLKGQHIDGLTYNPDGTILSVKEIDVKTPSTN